MATTLKSLREKLCAAQTDNDWPEDIRAFVEMTIDSIDRHRPLGPDGKHGDRHTPTCGCEDKR